MWIRQAPQEIAIAALRGTVADKVLAREGWYHCHESRLSGQPDFVLVAYLVACSVAADDEAHRHAALQVGVVAQPVLVAEPEAAEVLAHDALDDLGREAAAHARGAHADLRRFGPVPPPVGPSVCLPAPNTVLFDATGLIKIMLNEQITSPSGVMMAAK